MAPKNENHRSNDRVSDFKQARTTQSRQIYFLLVHANKLPIQLNAGALLLNMNLSARVECGQRREQQTEQQSHCQVSFFFLSCNVIRSCTTFGWCAPIAQIRRLDGVIELNVRCGGGGRYGQRYVRVRNCAFCLCLTDCA